MPAAKDWRYLWLALAMIALSSCSAYVTPESDESETLKELRRKSVPTSQYEPENKNAELRVFFRA